MSHRCIAVAVLLALMSAGQAFHTLPAKMTATRSCGMMAGDSDNNSSKVLILAVSQPEPAQLKTLLVHGDVSMYTTAINAAAEYSRQNDVTIAPEHAMLNDKMVAFQELRDVKLEQVPPVTICTAIRDLQKYTQDLQQYTQNMKEQLDTLKRRMKRSDSFWARRLQNEMILIATKILSVCLKAESSLINWNNLSVERGDRLADYWSDPSFCPLLERMGYTAVEFEGAVSALWDKCDYDQHAHITTGTIQDRATQITLVLQELQSDTDAVIESSPAIEFAMLIVSNCAEILQLAEAKLKSSPQQQV